MSKITELSKDELLSLIYNTLTDTYYSVHPCICASCGRGIENATAFGVIMGSLVEPLYYICDQCEE